MDRVWPLIGRDQELRLVEQLLATSGSLVLAGKAGSGRSRLASEVLLGARGSGAATAWIAGSGSIDSLPLGAFAHLLAEPVPDDPDRAIAETLLALERMAGNRDLVVAVDDAHLLDRYSAHVVRELGATKGVAVVATLRTDEPIHGTVAALLGNGSAKRIELNDLGWADVHELLFRVLGGSVSTETVERLWDATNGNVGHLRELVLRGLDSRALQRGGGVWTWSGPRQTADEADPVPASGLVRSPRRRARVALA
jgi:hypothetical protein